MDELEKEWVFDADSEISSSLIVGSKGDHKIIVFGTKKGTIYVLDSKANVEFQLNSNKQMNDLEALFHNENDVNSIYSDPIIFDVNNDGNPEFLICSGKGKLILLNSEFKELWTKELDAEVRTSSLLFEKQIFVTTMSGKLVCLDIDGNKKWEFEADSSIESSPSNFNKQIVFGTNSGRLYSIDLNGKLVWEFETKGRIICKAKSGMIKNEERLFFGSFDNYFYCLNIKGEEVWNYPLKGGVASEPVICDINNNGKKEIVFGSLDNNVYVLNEEGHKVWTYETDFWVVAGPIVADINNDGKKEIIAGSYDHKLYVLDSEGSFILDYVPGVSGATSQSGSYSDMITSSPGDYVGNKLMEYKAEDMIVGINIIPDNNSKIIIASKNGKIDTIQVKKKSLISLLKRKNK